MLIQGKNSLVAEMAELQNQADNPQSEIDGLSKEYQQMQDDYRQFTATAE